MDKQPSKARGIVAPIHLSTAFERGVDGSYPEGFSYTRANNPVLQRPLDLGCDLVVHSTTKYINGHADVLGGVVVAREAGELAKRIRLIQVHGGAVPSPFDCWLITRGLHTMRHRILAQCATAEKVADFLAGHAAVAAVHYPGLTSHPHHQLAQRQMSRFGALLSFELHGGQDQACKAIGKLAVFQLATSLGGVESLVEHRASMEGPGSLTPPGLIRMSVGLEEAAELIEDLRQALA